ncbi:hypothetical protein [Desulfoluna spongiiphila]|uniref:hypothetical protein n=1 Tax=Desulfoluna spongiiphila TaxID=419481 RepID=UPI00125A4AF5|nr:hypothetical protein [Desulfoluna spongiiphila]VVS92083.1 consensus disorder prediction [Desulfoluna spongiiphila]
MKRFLTVFFVLLASATGWASDEVTVPEPLTAWQGWVMHGHEMVACPSLNGDHSRFQCLWPGTLHLVAEQDSGRFRQEVTLFADGFVALPGDASLRPHTVTAGGAPVAVTLSGGRPRIYLEAGTHALAGRFSWARRPHAISVPSTTASLALSVDGAVVKAPYIDGEDRLWMSRPRQAPRENDQTSVEVARLFTDALPATVTTRLTLSVSGGKRRETLDGILLVGTSPVSLSSDLPARMGEDGSLEVDVKPGKWTVTVTAVYEGILSTLAPFGAPFGQEVWAFRRSSSMRLVSLEGLRQVDPEMTRLPEAWKRFPAYLATKGDVLGVTEVRRGQGKSASRLTLDREVWLDFDGGGATVRDRISGELNARRFVSLPDGPFEPGRIRLDGRDRMVADSGQGRFGVEVQKGRVTMDAVSRMGRDTSSLALPVGWNLAFDRTSMVVHLPVGWGILAVAGAAVESGRVFLDAWSLLDFFLILVVGVAAFKLWGPIWGILFVPGLVLLWQEPFSPALLWPAVLATTALVRLTARGDGWAAGLWGQGVRGLHGAVLVALVAVSLLFASQQLRQALYPQLELRHGGAYQGQRLETDGASRPMESMVQMDEVVSRSTFAKAKAKKRPLPKVAQPLEEGETQTGPALPTWDWLRVAAVTGPASEANSVTLHLVSPTLRRGLHVVRVAVLFLLLLRVAPVGRGGFFPGKGTVSLVLLGVTLSLCPRVAFADAFPPGPLLDELRSRLTEPPPCSPSCAALSRVALTLPQREADPALLVLRVDAQAHVAVPLPSGDGSWHLASAADERGSTLDLLKVDGETWVHVAPGIHTVVLKGEGGAEEWTFRFPLAPGTVRVEGTDGWQVSGITDTLQVDGVIRATRMAIGGDADKPLTGKGRLFSWFRVQRRMEFGLEWRVVTTVTRNGGDLSGPPVVMSVGLLDGEEIRTDLKGVKRTGDSVAVTFASGVTSRRWESVLPPGLPLALKASDTGRVVEAWTLHLDPIWHLAWKGIAPTGGTDRKGMVWLPRRGETVDLSVSRFEGAGGRTLTVDRARLSLWPGNGETRMELEAAIRASKGSEVEVTSRFNAHVKEVTVSGETVPVPEAGGKLTLPVDPGRADVRVTWRASEPEGFSPLRLLVPRKTFLPDLSLGRSASNIDLVMHLSRDRWILWTTGPTLGPAVLMWSIVALVLLAGAILGRVPFSPLSGTEWALLGLGLVTRSLPAVVLAAGWFFALEARRRKRPVKRLAFNAVQLGLVAWGVLVGLVLFDAVKAGLLGIPDMQIAGNGSTPTLLHWTVDRVAGAFPEPAVWTLSVWTFRLVMLAWSLWLALKVVGWIRWAGESLREGGFWMPKPKKKPETPAADAGTPEP